MIVLMGIHHQQQQQPWNSECLLYIYLNWGGGFMVYSWASRQANLCRVCKTSCRWTVSGYSHPGRKKLWLIISAYMVNSHEYLDQKKPFLALWASPEEDFAFPMGLRHWGFWHDFSPVNNTRSLWASLAHYVQAYMAGTLLTEASPRLLTLLLMSTVNHQLVVRSLWSSQCAQRHGLFGYPVYYFMMKWWVWKVPAWS